MQFHSKKGRIKDRVEIAGIYNRFSFFVISSLCIYPRSSIFRKIVRNLKSRAFLISPAMYPYCMIKDLTHNQRKKIVESWQTKRVEITTELFETRYALWNTRAKFCEMLNEA